MVLAASDLELINSLVELKFLLFSLSVNFTKQTLASKKLEADKLDDLQICNSKFE